MYQSGYQIDFLTFKPFSQIFEKDYRIKNLIAVDKSQLKSFKDILKFSKTLGKYDYIIDLHGNLRSFLLSTFTKGKVLRYKKQSLKRRLKMLDPNFNVVKAYLDTLKPLGISGDYRPKVILDQEDLNSVENLILQNYIVIGAGARYLSKMYPYYDQVAEILISKGYNIVLVGSKEDKEKDQAIYPQQVIDFRGKLSIRQSFAVISKSKLVISNDSAVAHMARSVGVKVLMIYGSTHPYFGFAPLKDEGDYIFKGLKCQPCTLHGKDSCKYGDFRCLTSISPQEVVEKTLSLL
ncbi:glycosyltransferase family 9 protein [Sulfurihydrogenibium subterraneum]|uniref:glycosyltransferase family 9 protein n=1 Tax=Sulfurihydrogenibium subterraneum TaxID=171121 RepID=UPI000A95C9F4|nr:glycosyltransferase family 9 protein [Sulfurihydrogenibium subterraneum]